MTREEFVNETQRLQDLYNKKLNDTQLSFWYDELHKYELEKYKRAIGEHAKSNKSMPALSDILAKIRTLQPRVTDLSNMKFEKVDCKTCHGSGLVRYYVQNYEYLCKCYCENGKRIDYPIKNYNEVFYSRTPEVKFDVTQINF